MPAVFSGMGVRGMGNGDRQKALQCLLLSPGITGLDVARQILNDYLETYRQYLPQFWQ